MRKATTYRVNEKHIGPLGQWAILRFDENGGYAPGYGPVGVYYVEHWAPWFSGQSAETSAEMAHGTKIRAVRALKSWVSTSEVPPPVA